MEASKKRVEIYQIGPFVLVYAPFEEKEAIKNAGFTFDSEKKLWRCAIDTDTDKRVLALVEELKEKYNVFNSYRHTLKTEQRAFNIVCGDWSSVGGTKYIVSRFRRMDLTDFDLIVDSNKRKKKKEELIQSGTIHIGFSREKITITDLVNMLSWVDQIISKKDILRLTGTTKDSYNPVLSLEAQDIVLKALKVTATWKAVQD